MIAIPVMGVGVRVTLSNGFTKGLTTVEVGAITIEVYVAVVDKYAEFNFPKT